MGALPWGDLEGLRRVAWDFPRDKALYCLFVYLGMKPRRVLELRRADVNLETGAFHVENGTTLTFGDRGCLTVEALESFCRVWDNEARRREIGGRPDSRTDRIRRVGGRPISNPRSDESLFPVSHQTLLNAVEHWCEVARLHLVYPRLTPMTLIYTHRYYLGDEECRTLEEYEVRVRGRAQAPRNSLIAAR